MWNGLIVCFRLKSTDSFTAWGLLSARSVYRAVCLVSFNSPAAVIGHFVPTPRALSAPETPHKSARSVLQFQSPRGFTEAPE